MQQRSELPEGWVETSLQELLTSLESGSRPKGGVREVKNGVPSVGGEHLNDNGGFRFNKVKYVPIEFFEKMNKGIIAKGDILIVKDGATTGKVSIVSDQFPFHKAVVNEHVFLCRLFPNLSNKYVFYFLFSEIGQNRILDNFRGSAQGGINKTFAPNTAIALPPLPEQHRIVAAVEALFAWLDAANARLERVPGILKQFRQAVLAAACEGRLTEDWRAEHSNIDIREYLRKIQSLRQELLQQKGKRHVESVCLSEKEIECLSCIPESWCWVRLEQVCQPIFRGSTPPDKDAPRKDGEVPFIKINNLTFDGSLDFLKNPFFISKTIHDKERKSSKVFPGDVLLNITGPPFGKVSIVSNEFPEWNVNQAIAVFRPISVSDRYLCLFLRNSQTINRLLKDVKQTVGQMNINLQNCRDIAFPLAPLPEQHEIVRRVDALFALADKIEAEVAAARAKTETMRQSILAQAFSGRLVPTEAELARQEGREYEPASVLLERIRSEKKEKTGRRGTQSTLT